MANVALAPSTIDTRDFYPRNVHIFGFQITDLMDARLGPAPRPARAARRRRKRPVHRPVDSTFPMAGAADAHRRLESRLALGKIVLVP